MEKVWFANPLNMNDFKELSLKWLKASAKQSKGMSW